MMFSCSRSRCTIIIIVTVLLGLSLQLQAQPYFPVKVKNKWGVIDSNGMVVLKPTYDLLYVYGKSNFITAWSGDSAFLINSRLQVVARTDYDGIYEIGEGIFRMRLSRKIDIGTPLYGLMDSTGKIIIAPRFFHMEHFNDGVAKAYIYIDTTGGYQQKNQRAGIIDKNGDWIIQPVYYPNWLRSSSDSLINFGIYEKGWGAMDVTGKIIIEPKYKQLGPYKYGYMEYSLNYWASGLMKKDGTVTIPDDGKHKVFYEPQWPNDTLVTVRQLKFDDNKVVPDHYNDCNVYSVNGRFLYNARYGPNSSEQSDGSLPESNKEQKQSVKRRYEEFGWSQAGLKQVRKNGKWGFINDEGKEILPCIFDDAEPFENGLAAVYVGGSKEYINYPDEYPNIKMGYINLQGKIVWKPSK